MKIRESKFIFNIFYDVFLDGCHTIKYNIFIDVRQLIRKILREESDKSLSNERLQTLIGNYIDTSYPTAIKVRLAPPGGNIELTLLTLPNPEDERDNLIFKMDAYGMPDYKINPEFFDSVRSMFGGQNKIKKVIFKWFDEKEVDNDLSQGSKKEEQNESELTERCWKGYTQKGMKTMFGKRYPNCVKIKK
jgi:hypothetical protein